MSSQRSKGMLELNREQVVLATAPKPMSRLLAHGIHGLEGLCEVRSHSSPWVPRTPFGRAGTT